MKALKAIIIAAGMGKRLQPFTDHSPKCLLPIGDRPLIQHTMDVFKDSGIEDISVVVGYKEEKIQLPSIKRYLNEDFKNNNILHSLMYAREELKAAQKENASVVISYSDIYFKRPVMDRLLESNEDISIVVDAHWQDNYVGRTLHPLSEAERVSVTKDSYARKVGKGIDHLEGHIEGEFIGLWKLNPAGIQTWLQHFNRLDQSLQRHDPFQRAKEWQKAYITDLLQEFLDQNIKVHCTLIKGNWMEIDTPQDYEKAQRWSLEA